MNKDTSCAWRHHVAFWSACLRALLLIFCLFAADDSFSLPNFDQSGVVSLWDHDGDKDDEGVRVARTGGALFPIDHDTVASQCVSGWRRHDVDDACRTGRRVRAFPPTGPPALRA